MGKGKSTIKTKGRNDERKNGKAWKKNPKVHPKKTNPERIGGYSMAKLAQRAAKRKITVEELIAAIKDKTK